MKSIFSRQIGFVVALFLAAGFQLRAQQDLVTVTLTTNTASLSADITPQAVLAAMQRVADWQLAHPSTHKPTDWTQAAGDTGLMALAGISGDAKYRAAARA